VAENANGLTSCNGCAFWRRGNGPSGTCHRHAPVPGHGVAEVVSWPQSDPSDACGDGLPADPSAHPLTRCRHCVFWREAAFGRGIEPLDRRDQPKSWWANAGYCRRNAPIPRTTPGYRGFWRVTHAADYCGQGKPADPP
jgi:hypothetical protein